MLAYSRAQNVHDREQRVEMKLVDVVREAITATEPVRQAKRQRISLTSNDDGCIVGEPTNIQRLVVNLLDNAARYAPDASTVDVGVTAEGRNVLLTVANEGPAIAPELRERVFEPYYRIPGSGSDGSGLGLAIVKEIASQHGASVELAAVEGDEGTMVTVRFPMPAQCGPGRSSR
jgi:two-component system sensor histidine kinase QseC